MLNPTHSPHLSCPAPVGAGIMRRWPLYAGVNVRVWSELWSAVDRASVIFSYFLKIFFLQRFLTLVRILQWLPC